MRRTATPRGQCVADGTHGDHCARITNDGRRCMCSCHGTGPEYRPGHYTYTGERAVPLHTVVHRGRAAR